MKRFVPCLVLLLWSFCLGTHAQPGGKQATPQRENRFLFILEASAATKRNAETCQRTVIELLGDEISGQMKPGDSFSIWTYNESLSAGRFPSQRWNPETRRNTLRQVTNFLATVKYEKVGRFDVLRPAIESVAKNSPRLTIILLTDGKQRVSGLKFDAEINKLFDDNYSAMREARMPFVTILVARNGEPVAFSVNSTLGPIKYPRPPPPIDTTSEAAQVQPEAPRAEKSDTAIASGKESSPATLSNPVPTVPVRSPEPRKATPVSPPTAAGEGATPISPDSKPVPTVPPPTAPTKGSEAIPGVSAPSVTPPIDTPLAKASSGEIPTPSPRVAATDTLVEKAPEMKMPDAPISKTKPPIDPPINASATNESSNVNKAQPVKLPSPAIAVINPVETTTGRRSLLGTALALVAVAIFLGYLLLRPKRDSSLITKSIHRLPK
ncbi:MAG: hypothetical protein H7X97_11630 [Opitutaceae bacterium]|nr:hypothetical protein [Verrucomicrobiales bacterium]